MVYSVLKSLKLLTHLTKRQVEIIKLSEEGLTYQEIGEKFDLSRSMVGTEIKKAKKRLQALVHPEDVRENVSETLRKETEVLTVRAQTVLEANGLSLNQAKAKSFDELLDLRNIGRKTAKEIQEAPWIKR